jgi:hypothetical protein
MGFDIGALKNAKNLPSEHLKPQELKKIARFFFLQLALIATYLYT